MINQKKIFNKILIVFISVVFLGIYMSYYTLFSKNYHPKKNIIIKLEISQGDDLDEVINHLSDNGALSHKWSFRLLSVIKKYNNNIKHGKFLLKGDRSYTNNELINLLRINQRQIKNLQIPENIIKINDLFILLEDSMSFSRGTIQNYLDTSDFLINNNFAMETLSAFFIPNTYELYEDASVSQFFARMKREYDAFWNDNRSRKSDSLGLSRIEISTLASIVEEEQDRRLEERSMIAGLYLNRIYQKIKLQSDPTVIFANDNFELKRVLYRHLRFESPYNTYIHHGMPPGPICIPSIHSIDAVLNAETHDYIFMCAKGDGSGLHNFAKTNREHINNRRKYKRNLNFN